MSCDRRAGLATLLLVTTVGCSSASTPASPEDPRSAPAAPAAETTSQAEPPPATTVTAPTPEPRVEVPTPAGLRAALDADRPTVELVPRVCPFVEGAAVATNGETGCAMDLTRGLPRAIRRFALTRERDVRVASDGVDPIVVVPSDFSGAITPFDGGVWRWHLATDAFDAIVAPASVAIGQAFGPAVGRTHFGVVISDRGSRDRNWLVADGVIRRLHPLDESRIGGVVAVEGHSYLVLPDGPRQNVLELAYDGDGHVRFERRGSVPFAQHLPLFVRFPEGRPLIASVFPRGRAATLHLLDLPAGTSRVVNLSVARPTSVHVVEHALEIRSATQSVRVDLATSEVTDLGTPVDRPGGPVAPLAASPSSFLRIGFFEDAALLLQAGGEHRWVREGGVTLLTYDEAAALPMAHEYDLDPPRGRCHCEGEALACPDAAPLADACAPARPATVRHQSGEGGQDPPPARGFSIDGRLRWDVLEPDLLRLTRLADGERLWLRVIGGHVLVHADDGAFWIAPGVELEPIAVRWGSSILEAPVSRLEDHLSQLRRDTLLADFFAGRALPRAELPTLAALAAEAAP